MQCRNCYLIYVPPEYFLSAEDEKARYDLHQNSFNDQGYMEFLNQLFIPLNELLSPKCNGLDFGSGPEPILSGLFENVGHNVKIYDHFYSFDTKVFEKKYDFITACEVVEHLHDPKKELDMLWSSLKPGGLIGIMTNLLADNQSFADWHYKNDLTHVCFFSESTFNWLAKQWQAEISYMTNNVIILRKILIT